MKVKICGIRDKQTANISVKAGADALGFVFAESKRQISISKAKEIIASLPKEVLKIGVFVNETKDNLVEIFEEVGLTHVQLHGDESPEFCNSLDLPVIKAISIKSQEDVKKIEKYDCEYILVDSPYGKYRGGNGTTFDWHLLLNQEFQNNRLILAGGLTIENVQEAGVLVNPYMVDVSSGVETEGVKDMNKIELFIRKVKLGGANNDNLYTSR
ncbi:phosphoribosylanthranilate isomerase [Neobacillus sp. D3-1R]|uniref:phosphoribosylanthranilate isomerase n=1 Tax=Neobacillus sp. D3-1R TaxID=3445778 RepID=UPI003F9FD69A